MSKQHVPGALCIITGCPGGLSSAVYKNNGIICTLASYWPPQTLHGRYHNGPTLNGNPAWTLIDCSRPTLWRLGGNSFDWCSEMYLKVIGGPQIGIDDGADIDISTLLDTTV